MLYLLLIYSEEKRWDAISADERQKTFEQYLAYTDSIRKSGHHRAGEGLQPTSTARTVRVRDGKVLSTDGPFAETKEQLGGFYLVEAATLDEAAALAARIPSATVGSIEVRPILETH